MTLTAGDMLTDNLLLERELGSGGMGVVWVAKNCALGTQVAVKVLHVGGDPSRTRRERFAREARGLAQLEHPNLVRLFDYGMTPDGEPFLVMELLRGDDLAQRLERVGRLDLGTASAIVTQACRGLGRAHEAGVVHRDIKPANLFLSGEGAELGVKVLDFGVARFGEDQAGSGMTRTGVLVGTPAFMSPEQLVAPKTVDWRSDLWAMGIVTYAALTSRLPYEGETPASIGIAVMEGARPPIRSLRPDLPPAIDAWVERALAKDPEQRFQSARELAEGLAQVASGAALAPTNLQAATTAPVVVAPTSPRSKAWFVAIGLVVASVLGFGGWIGIRRAANTAESAAETEAEERPTRTDKSPSKSANKSEPTQPMARPEGDLGAFEAADMTRVDPTPLFARADAEAKKLFFSSKLTHVNLLDLRDGALDLTKAGQAIFGYEVMAEVNGRHVEGNFAIKFQRGRVSKFPGSTEVLAGVSHIDSEPGLYPIQVPQCPIARAAKIANEAGVPSGHPVHVLYAYYGKLGRIWAFDYRTDGNAQTLVHADTCAYVEKQ